jgi:phage terminase Nu1 subunit (DNA packaging protein)
VQKQKSESPQIVGIKELAVLLNLSIARISQLVKLGLPKKCRGKYDRDQCAGWYIRYLQALAEKKAIVLGEGGEAFISERAERLRLLRADADLREMELARERSQLVAIQDVEKEMAGLILVTRARVLAIGARVAPALVGENSRLMIQAVIETAQKEVLSRLAKQGTGL